MRIKAYLVFILFIVLSSCIEKTTANSKNDSIDSTANEVESMMSHYNAEGATYDIKKGQIKILFPGGEGLTNTGTKQDIKFEKKYNVQFYCQGCIRWPGDDESGYNKIIFEYLDSIYGKTWRNKIRKDAISLNQDA